jgi:hypothetical protein
MSTHTHTHTKVSYQQSHHHICAHTYVRTRTYTTFQAADVVLQAPSIHVAATGVISAIAPQRVYNLSHVLPETGVQCGGALASSQQGNTYRLSEYPQAGAGGGHGGVGGQCCHNSTVFGGGSVKGVISSFDPPWDYGGYGGPCTKCVRTASEAACCRYNCTPCVEPNILTPGGGRIR